MEYGCKKVYLCKSLVEQTLKFITGIAKRPNVSKLKTSLFLANTQAIRQMIERKTFHLRQLFLSLHNWQYCKEVPVLSQKLFIEKLYNARIYHNLGEEICSGWPFLLILIRFDRSSVEQSGVFDKEGQCSFGEANSNVLSTTIPVSV